MMNDPRAEQYEMIQPRENMERVEEDQEEDMAGHDDKLWKLISFFSFSPSLLNTGEFLYALDEFDGSEVLRV